VLVDIGESDDFQHPIKHQERKTCGDSLNGTALTFGASYLPDNDQLERKRMASDIRSAQKLIF
jgi:hypothetical protein